MKGITPFWDQIRKGALVQRVASERRRRSRQERLKWWKSQRERQEYFETKIEQGIRMRLYFESELAKLIYCDEYELAERKFLGTFLKKNDIFVDLGANIGLFSLIASRLVEPSGKVYAFEPGGNAFNRLAENIRLNSFKNISCFRMAISDHEGESPLKTSLDGFDAWNSFATPIEGKSFETEMVKCSKWDDFALENRLVGRVTMMKIDVEGWEMNVLEGGRESLSRMDAPVLQIEFTDEAAKSAGFSCAELYHQLENLGYKMFHYDPSIKDILPDPLRKSYPYMNLIASKNPNLVRKRIKRKSFISKITRWV